MDYGSATITISIAALLSVFGAVGYFAQRLFSVGRQMGQIEIKVDTMWAFQMRRTMSDAVASGLGSVNSPFKFNEDMRHALAPMKAELIEFWKTLPNGIEDSAALLKIEAQFGEQILRLVGLPFGLTHDACLLLALTIAKQSNIIELTPGVPIHLELPPEEEKPKDA